MALISSAEPSLSSRAMLCSLSISVWSARKHDAEASEEIARQHEWAIAAEQALRVAKSCGSEPTGVERSLTESRESQQDWRAILRDFVAATAPKDYRWTPPNRRHIASGLYLPSIERQGVGKIVIAVDTSGSIGRLELEQFAAEISAIAEEVQPDVIHVVYCDAAVQSVQQFGALEPVLLEPKGGGGTDFRPVFNWVTENGIAPACFIYLTDLYCDSFPDVPGYPVLWVTDSRGIVAPRERPACPKFAYHLGSNVESRGYYCRRYQVRRP